MVKAFIGRGVGVFYIQSLQSTIELQPVSHWGCPIPLWVCNLGSQKAGAGSLFSSNDITEGL